MSNLKDSLSVSSIKDNIVTNFDYKKCAIFSVVSTDIFLETEEYKTKYLENFSRFFSSQDEGLSISFFFVQELDEVTTGEYGDSIKERIRKDYESSLIQNEAKKALRKRQLYVCLYVDRVSDIDMVVSVFSELNIGIRACSTEETMAIFWRYLNPGKDPSTQPEASRLEQPSMTRAVLTQSPIIESNDHLDFSNMYTKTVSLYLLPNAIICLNMIALLTNLCEVPYTFNLHIQKPDQKKIEDRLTSVAALIPNAMKKGRSASIQSQTHISDILLAHEAIVGQGATCLSVQCSLTIMDTDMETLNRKEETVLKKIKQYRDTIFINDKFNQWNAWLSVLPHHEHKLNRYHGVLDTNIGYFIPTILPHSGEDRGDFECRTAHNERISLSLIENKLPASHGLVIGQTGKGKSFLVNWLIKNTWVNRDNVQVLIIDFGGSYEKICTLFKGSYFRVSLNEDYPLTIFPRKKYVSENGQMIASQRLIISQLITIVSGINKQTQITNREEHLIQKTIMALYENKPDTFLPKLTEYVAVLETMACEDEQDATFKETLARSLSIYVDPEMPYYHVFNSNKELDLTNPFIVFDLTEVEQNPAIASAILHIISNLARLRMFDAEKTGLRQLIIRDECWKVLAEGSDVSHGKVIEEEYRTARKYGSVLLSVSQSMNDFLSGSFSKAIRENSYIKFVLPMDTDTEKLVHFGFNENEMSYCQRLKSIPKKFNEIFLKYGKERHILHLEPTELEKEICSKDLNNTLKYKQLSDYTDITLFEALKETMDA